MERNDLTPQVQFDQAFRKAKEDGKRMGRQVRAAVRVMKIIRRQERTGIATDAQASEISRLERAMGES